MISFAISCSALMFSLCFLLCRVWYSCSLFNCGNWRCQLWTNDHQREEKQIKDERYSCSSFSIIVLFCGQELRLWVNLYANIRTLMHWWSVGLLIISKMLSSKLKFTNWQTADGKFESWNRFFFGLVSHQEFINYN